MENSITLGQNRILFVDILKVIALIIMPCIHTYNLVAGIGLFGEGFSPENVGFQMGVIYLFAPTIFMLCMGMGMAVSKNNSCEAQIKRGLHLLLVGLLLNMTRSLMYLVMGFTVDSQYFYSYWYWLWGSDILYFAGLYFIMFGLLKKAKASDKAILFICVAMAVLSGLLEPVNIENQTLIQIVGNIIYVDEDSCFPLLSWSIYPILGYYFMKYFEKAESKENFILKVSGISALLVVIVVGTLKIFGKYESRYFLWGEDVFRMDIPSTLLALGVAGVYIGLIFALSKAIKGEKVKNLLTKISSSINQFYCIHWVILLNGAWLWNLYLDFQVNSTLGLYAVGVAVFMVSAALAIWYNGRRKKMRD